MIEGSVCHCAAQANLFRFPEAEAAVVYTDIKEGDAWIYRQEPSRTAAVITDYMPDPEGRIGSRKQQKIKATR